MFFWKKKRDVTLIVGLGNPRDKHARNRHNIGFMCVEHLARSNDIRLNKSQGQALIGSGEVAGLQVILAQPQTFVNRSGLAVSWLVRKYQVTRDRLIVIHDDLDLPSGRIRVRHAGSSAGHRGVMSIADSLGGSNFTRIRVGIGRPAVTVDKDAEVVDYVLGDLTPEEEKIFEEVIPRVSDAVQSLLTEGLDTTMKRFN
ncbi:MAG: aminoacyl-tRNA hydrolase [Dehalococcoidales bacterium]|nr:MAG: aminoacyl-tRNA hydrolase [Dehalococcoidales bacterium]